MVKRKDKKKEEKLTQKTNHIKIMGLDLSRASVKEIIDVLVKDLKAEGLKARNKRKYNNRKYNNDDTDEDEIPF